MNNKLQTKTDIVAVYDENFNQVFPQARSIKVSVKRDTKSMESPLENGASVVDHIVFLPTEFELSLATQGDDAESIYQEIRQYFSKSTLLTLHTASGVDEKIYITSMPHEESSDNIDVLIIAVKLKQAQLANSRSSSIPINNVKNPSDSNAVDKGTVHPKVNAPRSIASKLFYWGS